MNSILLLFNLLLLFTNPIWAAEIDTYSESLVVLADPTLRLSSWFENSHLIPHNGKLTPYQAITLKTHSGKTLRFTKAAFRSQSTHFDATIYVGGEYSHEIEDSVAHYLVNKVLVNGASLATFVQREKIRLGKMGQSYIHDIKNIKSPGFLARRMRDPLLIRILSAVEGSKLIGLNIEENLEGSNKTDLTFYMKATTPYYVYSNSIFSNASWESQEDSEQGVVDLNRRRNSDLENQVLDVFSELSKIDRPAQDWSLKIVVSKQEIESLSIFLNSPKFPEEFQVVMPKSRYEFIALAKAALPDFMADSPDGQFFEKSPRISLAQKPISCVNSLLKD